MKKTLGYLMLTIITGVIVLVILAFESEKSIQAKYWDGFNEYRSKKGIYPLIQSTDTIIENWGNLFQDDQFILKWKWILNNEEIATTSSFVYDSVEGKPFHQSKSIIYGTYLFFWKNFYAGEIDTYVNQISANTRHELTIVYHSKSLDPGDFFYANIDTLYSGESDIFFCGTELTTEAINRIPVGNISKSKADEILLEWKVN